MVLEKKLKIEGTCHIIEKNGTAGNCEYYYPILVFPDLEETARKLIQKGCKLGDEIGYAIIFKPQKSES
ncbi:hypothetical protein ES703_98809 [subsurface metagenome]